VVHIVGSDTRRGDRVTEHLGNPNGNSQGKGIFRNSLLNFLGQVLPLGVAAVAVPFIIRDMGLERYGLLSLSWILLGYFTFLDMGLGRATTNAVADLCSSDKREQIGLVVSLSLLLNFLVGIVGGAVGWLITPWIVNTAFAVPAPLRAEATAMFSVLALSIPLITSAATLRGVLEGFQRFDYSNAVKSPALALMFLLPLMYRPLHLDLAQVVGLIVVSRFLAVLVFVWMVWKIDHKSFSIAVRVPGSMKQLLHYAGWVTVSNVFSPVLMYAERLLIAAMVPLGMVGFYTAPYEIISRLPMIPASVGTTLFPSFSSIPKDAGQAVVGRLFVRPTKFILFVVTPLAAVFIFFPTEILSVWLGREFAIRSQGVLVLLAAGFFFNCLAHVPLAALLGLGRPDLKAKVDIAEAFTFVALSYLFISYWGIVGAALAKTALLTLDVVVVFVLARQIMKVQLYSLIPRDMMYFSLASLCFLGVGLMLDVLSSSLMLRIVSFLLLAPGFVLLFLRKILTAEDQKLIPLLRRYHPSH
jgi:O-antigen/teichoic acid export membrane protein